jgi:hypothetical protein
MPYRPYDPDQLIAEYLRAERDPRRRWRAQARVCPVSGRPRRHIQLVYRGRDS